MVEATVRRVGNAMTRSPHSVGMEENLARAAELMKTFGIHHLPVLENGRPVGMLRERDIVLAESLSHGRPARLHIGEVMVGIPYCTGPETPVAEVAKHLASRKLDAALVMSGNQVIGVFTTTDALVLLGEVLTEPQASGAQGTESGDGQKVIGA